MNDIFNFEAVYPRLHVEASSLARKFIYDRGAAEDIATSVLLRVWKIKSDFLNERAAKAYISTGVYFACYNYLRKKNTDEKHREHIIYQIRLTDTPSCILDQMIEKYSSVKLSHAINKLPRQTKIVTRLTMEGLSTVEVADILGIHKQTVRNTRVRAYGILRPELESE
ncbi:sigma-70 family RNA polymerase sigma factor [Dinghuibacter silviterrae]|uniref:RNA polymerase sigma factor (Sigma-70 family) n=1 Tax=Dinghuibacter silviterrae TaxID=1539049 RepID=A0A4R8DH93_9BACT|nr:sigma-70 family RNA polymerase sigma factor [Dinghuibacter silviterrae]TDW97079.1 RNA polymerase sigma factor (sigma-70 family) [Dinghuibacter silviterrae]